jgi:hypothetical protein
MNQKQQITQFIKNVAGNNYSKANQLLGNIINEKLKNRIRKVDTAISNKNQKTS